MNLLDFSEQSISFDSKDSVSKVTSKMFENKTYNVIITSNGKYQGIVSAREISKRNINNPDKVEVKKFIKKIKPISPETPINDVIDSVLVNNYNVVPVTHDEIYILTKLGILNMIKDSISLKKKANDLMRYPYCVSTYDSISTVIAIMKEMNVSRVPVIGSNGDLEGLVTTIDLLRADIKRQRSKLGEKYGEKQKAKETPISSIMYKKTTKTKPSTPIKTVIETMINKKTETVLIEEKGKIVGIITPTEILKTISDARKEKEIEDRIKGVYVRIEGIQEEDDYIKSLIDSEITHHIQKLGKIITIDYMVLHVNTSKRTGNRKNYSVKGRLITEKGYFFANKNDWDLTKAVRSVMNKFEREIMKSKEKNK